MPLLRRELLATSLLLASTAALAAIPAQVKTDKGTVEGEPTTDGQVMAYKGIPSTEWLVMHLDNTSAAKPDAHRDRYLFLDSVWSKPKLASAPQ